MPITFHHADADLIPRDYAHALLHTRELQWLRLTPESIGRWSIETWCDRMHERWTVHGVAHVCWVNGATGRIQQLWVMDPKDVLNGGIS